jgi:hypothetical protein
MANNTAKTLVTFFDKACKQLEKDTTMAENVMIDTVAGDTLQNSNNIYWRNVEQQSDTIEGWDLSGSEGQIIEQAYPLTLSDPVNTFKGFRVDELRDQGFMDRSVRASADKLSSDQNKKIAALVGDTGSLYYESSATGYDFLAEGDTILTERQAYTGEGTCFTLDPRANQVMASDLAARGTLSMRPEDAYATGLIGEQVAGFDKVYRGAYTPSQAAATAGTTTVATDLVDVPEGFTTGAGGVLVNVDYRVSTISLTDATTFAVGDVITIAGVNSVGLMDKIDTGELMTCKIVAKSGNDIDVYPKLIAADQAAITSDEAAYANISTAVVATMVVSKVNTVGGRSSLFWAKDSIEIVNGNAPLEMLNEFEGMKVDSATLASGVKLYMAYDARLDSLNCRVRLFTWYGLVNKDPSRNGQAVYVPA